MTTYTRGATLVATAALLLAATTSCADNGNDPSANPTSSPSSQATEATPTPPSETELASEAASDVLRQFYDVRNQLRHDPEEPLDLLDSVATSTELSAQQNLFRKEREQGLHQV